MNTKENSDQPWSNEELVRKIQNGENARENMEQLYKQNRGFICKMAIKYSDYADKDDLLQEAYFALVSAVNGFDCGKNNLFLTYFGYWLKSYWKRYIGNTSRVIRIPLYIQDLSRKYSRFVNTCEKEGRQVTDQDVCRELKITENQLNDMRTIMRLSNCVGIDTVIRGTEELTIADKEADPFDMEEETMNKIIYDRLWEIVDDLRENQTYTILGRYRDSKKYRELAEERGCSKQRIQQIEKTALGILRQEPELQDCL